MSTNGELLLFDTSAAMAFVDADNPYHNDIWSMASTVRRGLSGHAAFEFYSVLTRLPPPKRLDRIDALRLVRVEFPESRFLPEAAASDLLEECVSTGISGVWSTMPLLLVAHGIMA